MGFPDVPCIHEAPISIGAPIEVSVHTLPPTLSLPSKTVTSNPLEYRAFAADIPATPAPITIILFFGFLLSSEITFAGLVK